MTPSILLVMAVVSISVTECVRLTSVLAQHIGDPGSNTQNVQNVGHVIQPTEALLGEISFVF